MTSCLTANRGSHAALLSRAPHMAHCILVATFTLVKHSIYLVSPFQDGFFLEYIFIVESLENVGYFGQQVGMDFTNQFLEPDQQVFLRLLVVNHKLNLQRKHWKCHHTFWLVICQYWFYTVCKSYWTMTQWHIADALLRGLQRQWCI